MATDQESKKLQSPGMLRQAASLSSSPKCLTPFRLRGAVEVLHPRPSLCQGS